MIAITPTLALDERDFELDFVRASGPGGQNVNKVATAVQLRYDTQRANLPADVRERLHRLAGTALTGEGVLVIEARRHRTQGRNRQDAIDRLVALLRQAATPPRPRHETRVPAAAKAKRLEKKRRQGERKRLRGRVEGE